MRVVVGGIIEKDGKFLLVQEGKESCYGKWNLPAGRLDCNETLEQGALREIKEETGCDVELTGIVNISNRVMEDDIFITIVFATKLINENIRFDKKEILDVQWFSYDEIINQMDNKLRDKGFIKPPIINYNSNKIGSMDLINSL